MRVIAWPGDQPESLPCCVATLGVFDGVHLGHARVIERTLAEAGKRACGATIVTFDREPTSLLRAHVQPAITSLDHRVRLFEGMGVDLCVVVNFTEEIARMSAEAFAQEVFRELLGARLLVLGFDCRFGRDREGGPELCRRLGFGVVTVSPVELHGRPVSSTAIRQAIRAGEFRQAARLLGRPFSLYGTVVHGDGRGRRLGYPTANLDLHNETVPPSGVYASLAYTDGEPLPAVTSVGVRPTFHEEPGAEMVVEVHLIDYEGELYGQDLEVQFVEHLRDQETFGGAGGLRKQIERDVENARMVLARGDMELHGPPADEGTV
ncbi:MAG: riboflavin biosynthesis protein RibF [Candidatus Brocadiaceae bacterium]|jgi:riboflavin kinase/FMN adenylyltransferase